MTEAPLLCHKCGADLAPGRGDFYVVRIEAFADPSPPVIEEEDLAGSFKDRINALIEQMDGLSEQELMDQVYRRLTLYLCGRCYRTWIERPAG
jgi:hypothetical protein